jgi:hypothetical protein
MALTNTSSDSAEAERGPKNVQNLDIEKQAVAEAHLKNTTVQNISWKGVTVTVKDRVTKESRPIVDNVEGIVEAGMYPPRRCSSTSLKISILTHPDQARSAP